MARLTLLLVEKSGHCIEQQKNAIAKWISNHNLKRGDFVVYPVKRINNFIDKIVSDANQILVLDSVRLLGRNIEAIVRNYARIVESGIDHYFAECDIMGVFSFENEIEKEQNQRDRMVIGKVFCRLYEEHIAAYSQRAKSSKRNRDGGRPTKITEARKKKFLQLIEKNPNLFDHEIAKRLNICRNTLKRLREQIELEGD